MDEQDPFAVFGDDDDDDDVDDDNEEEQGDAAHAADTERARQLMEQANRPKSNIIGGTNDGVADSPGTHVTDSVLPVQDGNSADGIAALSWKPPLYSGPIRLMTSLPVGGGRGYVAQHDLSPGTLVLLEIPILAWPEGEASSIDLERIQIVLLKENANEVVSAMESFHPTRSLVNGSVGSDIASESPTQVEDMIQHYRETIQNDDIRLKTILQVAAAKEVTNSDGTAISELDVLRMLVALRYNSLETGIYLHVAMLNHQDLPNCVKFRPDKTKVYSEVRTTRAVKAGEPLTISYIPRFLCHASRRKHLMEQHRFDIGELDESSPIAAWERVHQKLPQASAQTELLENIEKTLGELRDQLQDLDDTATASKTQLEGQEAETAKALELAALEMVTSAVDLLGNENHILILACLALHLDTCDLVQRRVQLSRSIRARLLARLVKTGRTLAALQIHIVGPDHFDLARTNLDVAQAIQELLSEAPKELYDLEDDLPRTVHAWSAVEHAFRKEHERIKSLYPHDADKHLQTKNREA